MDRKHRGKAMTVGLFLGFVATIAAVVVALIGHYLDRRAAFRVLAGLAVWFIYVGLLSYLGVFRNAAMRPPGAAFLFAPILLFLSFLIVFVVRSAAGLRIALAFPLWIILGTECFRVGVEIFLHQLWIEGIVPKMLTFEGANVDIYVGVSAPLIAWLSTRGPWGLKLTLAWNVVGLLALTNVVTRAVLTSPGPFNFIDTEVPNRMFGTFPFMFIPGFFVPLAVTLHVLAIRAASSQLVTAEVGNRNARRTDPPASR
jgi:hypothetical protein